MTIKDADWGYRILRKMPSAEQATLVEKIIRKPLRFGNVKASFHAALSLKVF